MCTRRQALALHLSHVEGWSFSRIGAALGCDRKTAWELVRRGERALVRDAAESGPDAAVAALSAHLHEPENYRAAQRQGEAYEQLEEHVRRREWQLEELAAAMGEDGYVPQRSTPELDRWELQLLAGRKAQSLTMADYEAARLGLRFAETQ